jgi:HlyD family secretion protein
MPKKRRRRRWLLVLFAAVALIIVVNLLRGRPTPVVHVTPVKLETGPVVRRLAETGTIQMDRTVEVKSQVAGRVTRLLADEGDTVRRGQLLAVIDPDPNKALQLSGKRASVTRAEMELAEQLRQLEQKRQNFTDGIIAREEIERAEYSFELAISSLAQQRLELQILEREVRAQSEVVRVASDSLLMQDYEIVSPLTGIITARPVEEGELVTSAVSSNQGSILFNMGDPERLIVKVQISEVDIGEVKEGLVSEIRVDALPGETFRGRLRRLATTGSIKQGSQVVSFDAEVEVITSEPRLRHGMTADVDIIIQRVDQAPFLPVEAVAEVYRTDEEGRPTREIEKRVVFVREGETWTEQEVHTGVESNTRIEIVDGLTSDQEVHPDAQTEWDRRNGKDSVVPPGRPGPGR